MRSFAIASTALLSTMGAALAADLPMRAPAPLVAPAPLFTWTGFYIGAQVGAARQRNELAESSICVPTCVDRVVGRADGFVGGVHAGFNWQAGVLVFGVEGDLE